jgi:hypothetical protein
VRFHHHPAAGDHHLQQGARHSISASWMSKRKRSKRID